MIEDIRIIVRDGKEILQFCDLHGYWCDVHKYKELPNGMIIDFEEEEAK